MWLYVPEEPPEVTADELAVCSLYTGSAMLDQGFEAGWQELTGQRSVTVVACEREAYAAGHLMARMEDAALGRMPIWDDSRTFPCRTFRGKVGAVTAGFPCQPWSNAGARLGIKDPRWLWPDIARIVRGVRAGIVFLENVPGILCHKDAEDARGWRYAAGAQFILRELAEMGFDAEWCTISAEQVGANHERFRWFCLAVHQSLRDPNGFRRLHERPAARRAEPNETCDEPTPSGANAISHAPRERSPGKRLPARSRRKGQGEADAIWALAESLPDPLGAGTPIRQGERGNPRPQCPTIERARREMFAPGPGGWGPFWGTALAPAIEPGFRVLVDGIPFTLDASRADQLRLTGNGAVPLCAAVATVILGRRLGP